MEKENIQENYHESLKERKTKDTIQEIKERLNGVKLT